jgi:hypothetical protein
MAGVIKALFFEYCFRVALVEVVMSTVYLVATIMATLGRMPANRWEGSLAGLCLSLVRAGLVVAIGGGCRSPHVGGVPSRRTVVLHLQGWFLSLLLCGGYAYLTVDMFGHLSGPPDRPSLGAMMLACQVPCSLLSYLWACSCVGPFMLERREAIALGKAREAVPVSPWHVETFELGPDTLGDWDTTCVICFDDFAEGCVVGKLPCGHKFHDACIRAWLGTKDRCPMRCTVHCASVLGRPSEP